MKANPEQLIDLVDDPSEFIILVCLSMFPPSLNLKKISEYTNIPESSALRKIKELTRKGGIILDNDATMSQRGKFYKPSDTIIQMLEKGEQGTKLDGKSDKMSREEKRAMILTILDVFGALANFNSSMVQVAIRYLMTKTNINPNIIEEMKIVFSLSMMKLSLDSKEEKEEFLDICTEFRKKIMKFEQKENVHHGGANHSFFISVHPIGEFEIETDEDKGEKVK